MRLVDPVVIRPLKAEWEAAKATIAVQLAKRDRLRDEAAKIPSTRPELLRKFARVRTSANEAERLAQKTFRTFLERVREFRVLDPACGSGNFLYLALKALKDIEHEGNIEAETLGLAREVEAYTSPANVLGIEINEYAAELARVTVWIGELQWRLQHGYPFKVNPILDPLDQIECRDALLNVDGSEAIWPKASVVIGNPPFVGDKKMRAELGDAYTDQLRETFAGRISGGADFVTYWFEKSRGRIEQLGLGAAGLVATNSIRGGKNRQVLDAICRTAHIFEAWSDEPWINDGAAVRVSLICFGLVSGARLNGRPVPGIHADLSPTALGDASISDIASARPLAENEQCAFQGPTKGGCFDLAGSLARSMLVSPTTAGHSASAVLKPWFNGDSITSRWSDSWIVDFGSLDLHGAQLFDAPFRHVVRFVKPERDSSREKGMRERYWLFKRSGAEMKKAVAGLPRVLVTPEVSKHRVFVWLPSGCAVDKNLIAVARSDDTTMGLLTSRIHGIWALKLGTSLEDRPRYTSTTTFRTFPFPAGLTPAATAHQRTETLPGGATVPADLPGTARPRAEAIARTAMHLNDLRERWLNPPEWTRREPEVTPLGMDHSPYPDRFLPLPGHEKDLAQRTLTKLYNERPTWLAQAHETLDAAVAAAYGWTDYTPQMPDEEILRRLLALNRKRGGTAA